jgi:hypothetical protein
MLVRVAFLILLLSHGLAAQTTSSVPAINPDEKQEAPADSNPVTDIKASQSSTPAVDNVEANPATADDSSNPATAPESNPAGAAESRPAVTAPARPGLIEGKEKEQLMDALEKFRGAAKSLLAATENPTSLAADILGDFGIKKTPGSECNQALTSASTKAEEILMTLRGNEEQ